MTSDDPPVTLPKITYVKDHLNIFFIWSYFLSQIFMHQESSNIDKKSHHSPLNSNRTEINLKVWDSHPHWQQLAYSAILILLLPNILSPVWPISENIFV